MMRIGIAALALSLSVLPPVVTRAVAQDGVPDLRGAWSLPLSAQSSGGATAWVRETITFEDDDNIVRLEAFADEDATVPLFNYESRGPYEITGSSPSIPDAWHLEARNEDARVTVFQDLPDVWNALNLGQCEFEIGVPLPIKDCVSGPPFNSAGCTEQDLVRIEGSTLRLGDRAADRCVARPKTLSDLGWMKQQ